MFTKFGRGGITLNGPQNVLLLFPPFLSPFAPLFAPPAIFLETGREIKDRRHRT